MSHLEIGMGVVHRFALTIQNVQVSYIMAQVDRLTFNVKLNYISWDPFIIFFLMGRYFSAV